MQHHSKPPDDPAETVVNARSSPPTAPVDWPASHTARAEFGALRDSWSSLPRRILGSEALPCAAGEGTAFPGAGGAWTVRGRVGGDPAHGPGGIVGVNAFIDQKVASI